MESSKVQKQRLSARHAYVTTIAAIGLSLFGWAVFNLTESGVEQLELLVGLILLNTVAQIAVISTQRKGIAFGTSHAVNLAAVAFFDLNVGVVVACSAVISLTLIRTIDREQPWKNSLEQLAFNTGMEVTALYLGGSTFLLVRSMVQGEGFLAVILAWLAGSFVLVWSNRLILTGIIYITRKVKPLDFIRNNAWALPINIAIGTVGGYILTGSIMAIGWQGIMLFVMPFMLSSYSLRMYVRETDRHEAVVNVRTQQLAALSEQLEQLEQDKERVVSVLSQDVQRSLMALRSSAEILNVADGELDETKRKQLYDIIMTNGSQITHMVENLVSIEQMNTDAIQPNIDAFDLGKAVYTVVESFRSVADAKGINLRCEVDSSPVIISADQQMVRHVIANLLSNALKFTDAGGDVKIAMRPKPHCVMVNVEDSGVGIASEEIGRIFDPYYRVPDHAERTEGAGLGLAIVKRFVEAQDGSITVKSRPDQGSSFQIRLPYKVPTPVTQLATSVPMMNAAPA